MQWFYALLVYLFLLKNLVEGKRQRRHHSRSISSHRHHPPQNKEEGREPKGEAREKHERAKSLVREARDEAISRSAIALLYICSQELEGEVVASCQRRCAQNSSCGSIVLHGKSQCWQRKEFLNSYTSKKEMWCAQHPRNMCGSDTAILDRSLILEEVCAARLARGLAYRYFSLVNIREYGYTLMARIGRYPDANPHEALVFWSELDPRLSQVSKTQAIPLPNLRGQHNTARGLRDAGHNYAWLKSFGQRPPVHPILYGGRGEVEGIVKAVVHPNLSLGRFSDIDIMIKGNHSGCIEAVFPHCRYDGKISAVQVPPHDKNKNNQFKSHTTSTALIHNTADSMSMTNIHKTPREVLLYLRLNQGHNLRFLQVSKAPTPHGPFGPLQPISIATWDACRTLHSSIYFASVNPNPVDDNTLLAFLPTQWNKQCTLYLSATCDGVRFSPPAALLDLGCIEEGRSRSYPIDGLYLTDDDIYFYVHASMPTRDSVSSPHFDPALRRYALNRGALKLFTTKAKIALGNSCPNEKAETTVEPPLKTNFSMLVQADDHRLTSLTAQCEHSRIAAAVKHECIGTSLLTTSLLFRPYDAQVTEAMPIQQESNICPQESTTTKKKKIPRVAVCIAGTRLELFLSRIVQRGIRDHLHHPGYEYFISIDKALRPDHPDIAKELRPHIRAIWTDDDSLDNPRYAHDPCTNQTANHRFLVPMARRIAKCYHLIENAEKAQNGIKYDYILRVRPDHIFRRKLLPAENWLLPHDALGSTRYRILLYDDQLALSTRDYAQALLLGPQAVYTQCYDATHWSSACAINTIDKHKKLRLDNNEAPCCPMNLIVHSPYFPTDTNTKSIIRQCNSVRRPGCGIIQPCDIDILRGFHRDPHRPPRTEYGCSAADDNHHQNLLERNEVFNDQDRRATASTP